MTHIYF